MRSNWILDRIEEEQHQLLLRRMGLLQDARYIVGDVLTVLKTLPDDSIDLVLTSPPFLALRSYLPADHPNKELEGGTQPTPSAYLDWLLDVVEALDRVLTARGSMVFEMGDTYAGSGGGGGDYLKGGRREGQAQFAGSAASMRESNAAHWRQKNSNRLAWPLSKSLTLAPELFRFALVYGFNPFTGRQTEQWRLRNIVRWCRPNPPVGALGDKLRPATSDIMVFTKSSGRFYDFDAVRELTGAPPLDFIVLPTHPYKGAHYATWPSELLPLFIKSMCPEGGTVLDPFAGSGTTLAVATGHGRNAIGIDLDERNLKLARQRVGFFLVET